MAQEGLEFGRGVLGILGIFNLLSYIFIIGHIHMQIYLGIMEKREKLLAIYDAIPPRVWAEMALQLLSNPPKF